MAFVAFAALAAFAASCESDLDPSAFQRKVEQTFVEANPGFGVLRRDKDKSTFARGDQTYSLDVSALYGEYKASKKGGGAFLSSYGERLSADAKERRRSLEQAREDVIPIVKSGAWIRVQDVGAIGPPSTQEQLRPWRKELGPDLFVILGVPEKLLGYRYVSIHEVKSATVTEQIWLDRATANLARRSKDVLDKAVDVHGSDKRLLVSEIDGQEGVSALVLDRAFRQKLLNRFNKDELGAALPTRDVLMVFDSSDFVATKPARSRAHQLFDTQNHAGFRGLIRFDKDLIAILESGKPDAKEK
jgi:hypothetical protein